MARTIKTPSNQIKHGRYTSAQQVKDRAKSTKNRVVLVSRAFFRTINAAEYAAPVIKGSKSISRPGIT